MKFISLLERYLHRIFNETHGISNTEHYEHSETDAIFATFVQEHLDRKAYLKAYPDVKAAGIDPVKHWLAYGMVEGRFLAPNAKVIIGKNVNSVEDNGHWQRFTWNGQPVAVKIVTLQQSLVNQILDQSRHDPAVLAAGALAIGNLRQFDATNLLDRNGIDVRNLFAKIVTRPNVVIVTPFLCAGGAEKFAADLVGAFSSLNLGPILVLVTEDTADTACDWESLSILAPFMMVNVVFWRDICGPDHENPTFLARLLNSLRPSIVVVNNSRVGLEMVARFGRGLSKTSKLYCTYFSLGVKGLGAPYGVRYPRKTMPYSIALTDNEKMATQLRQLWGPIVGPGIEVLPPKVQPAEESAFNARLEARQERVASPLRSFRWVWISRIEPFKGTAILGTLARMLPAHQFDLFGPIQGDLNELGLALPNIAYCGVLTNVSAADFTEYDGFVFTSLSEGMPNLVLEMSQHAIPMVLAEVGGLHDTFNDLAALFVPIASDTEQSAVRFKQALERVVKLSPSEVKAMIEEAHTQAIRRHSPVAYLKNVNSLVGGVVING